MRAIEQWVPHRPPFLFVDEIVSVEKEGGRFVLALAAEDPRLYDGALPALLLVEALAQSTAAFHGITREGRRERGMLVEIQDAKLFGAATSGDRVLLDVERTRVHGQLARFRGRASVGGRPLVEAELTVVRAPEGEA